MLVISAATVIIYKGTAHLILYCHTGEFGGVGQPRGDAWFKNLASVKLGNIIGAIIFQGMIYWYVDGMQKWIGPGKWLRPHGTCPDLVYAFRDTGTLMLFFVGMVPPVLGGMLVFAVEPLLGIESGTHNPDWGEPILITVYLVATALITKWTLMPRRPWYQIPGY